VLAMGATWPRAACLVARMEPWPPRPTSKAAISAPDGRPRYVTDAEGSGGPGEGPTWGVLTPGDDYRLRHQHTYPLESQRDRRDFRRCMVPDGKALLTAPRGPSNAVPCGSRTRDRHLTGPQRASPTSVRETPIHAAPTTSSGVGRALPLPSRSWSNTTAPRPFPQPALCCGGPSSSIGDQRPQERNPDALTTAALSRPSTTTT